MNIINPWKEHFKDLLSLANMSSVEEAESEDSGEANSVSLAEVAEVVKKAPPCKVSGVDEIGPEMLKALDILGLSWLTRLFSAAWKSGTVHVECQTGVVIPIFQKGNWRVCSHYQGITVEVIYAVYFWPFPGAVFKQTPPVSVIQSTSKFVCSI